MQNKINLYIIDDGSLDTVVYDSISKKQFRYDSEFRFTLSNSNKFLILHIKSGFLTAFF